MVTISLLSDTERTDETPLPGATNLLIIYQNEQTSLMKSWSPQNASTVAMSSDLERDGETPTMSILLSHTHEIIELATRHFYCINNYDGARSVLIKSLYEPYVSVNDSVYSGA